MRVAVIGAGITGLVAAQRLSDAGHETDVYERWPGLGGQVATMDLGTGDRLEHYYHHLFTSDVHIARLCEQLGMEDAIEWLPSSVAVFARGRTYPFTTPMDLLRFKPLSLGSRIRTGYATLRLGRRHRDASGVAGTTARDWIVTNMGQQVWDELWGPLLRGKFGDRAEDIDRPVEGGGTGDPWAVAHLVSSLDRRVIGW